ncbi:hypothetical protein NFJ01_14850 [Lelliottia amnigena]|uniref:hypothetical protein n=1 Tax=Lelliottia amnigena TaxID=61646 RepID=UPI0020910891|nr:hypothetical protein [Lelliottia amnigena]USR59551.1 hypothetical protein NFJ01_14850 [Lelliottia amnigena]
MNGNKSDVKLKNERELRFYRWLYKNESALLNYQLKPVVNAINISYLYSLDIERASRVINSAVRSFYHPDIANTFGRASRGHITENFIPSRDFAWFKKCQDACYYVWLAIRTIDIKMLPAGFTSFDISDYGSPFVPAILTYDHLDLIQYPASHTERLLTITDFFDRCDSSLKGKMELLNAIRAEWYRLYNYKDVFPLTKKEKEKCEWAWKYLQKDRANIKAGAKKRKENKESEIKKQENSSQGALHKSSGEMDAQDNKQTPHIVTLAQVAQHMPQQHPISTLTELARHCPSSVGYNDYATHSSLKHISEDSASINTITLMKYLKPSSNAEKRLIIRCLYTCWYHKDSGFLKRFNKAWDGVHFRKKYRIIKKSTLSPETTEADDTDLTASQIPSIRELPREKTLAEALREVCEQNQTSPSVDDEDANKNNNKPFMDFPY